VYIVNDGGEDILFNFDSPTSGANAFTLKPGGILEEEDIAVKVLWWKTVTGTSDFRAFGLT